jgi:hypothetical protein
MFFTLPMKRTGYVRIRNLPRKAESLGVYQERSYCTIALFLIIQFTTMSVKMKPLPGFRKVICCFVFVTCFTELNAQITTYQYRKVPDDKIAEFIKRETTYWSKVAQKAVENKKMTFWALLEKIGGYNLPGSPNYLFINTFPNMDSLGDMWSDVEKIAGVSIAEMETNSISTTVGQFFFHDEDWVQADNANDEKDFNYVVFNFHNTQMPDSFITLEKKYWHPFIKSAMNKNQTKQRAWGNAMLLSPTGPEYRFSTISYDLFATLQDALLTPWDPKTPFPLKDLNKLEKIKAGESSREIYRIIKVVSAP